MRGKKVYLFSVLSLAFCSSAFAQYYKTLPKGVRLGVYRNVKTTEIDSTFNHTDNASPLSFEVNANIDTLTSLENDTVSTILEILKPYPKAYEALNLGTYRVDASAEVEVDGYGFAYGITNKVTAYMALPIYKADVRMKYKRAESNNYKQVAEILQQYTNDDYAQNLGNNIDQYANELDVDSSFIQNLVVNNFGYDEVGNWSGSGLGDLELGVMYNFLTEKKYGLLLTLGGVAPTGRIDDPDIIQDIGFGDGQWDAFTEFGGSYLLNNSVILNSFARYTHQFSSEKSLRVPYSKDLDFGDQKGRFEEKLGNKTLWHLSSDFIFNDWFSVNTAYEYSHTDKASYKALENTIDSNAAEYLAYNTESVEHNLRVTGELSSVTPFMKKNFILPGAIKFIYQHMLEGRNTPKVDRYEIEFRMFF